jgi:hypothetical protein
VEIIAAGTIYGMFSAFLVFPHLGLDRRLQWAAMTLLSCELLALALYSYYRVQVGRVAAEIDVPVLSLALLAVGMMRAVQVAR